MRIQLNDPPCKHSPVLRQYCVKCYQNDYYREHGKLPPLVYDPADDGVPPDVLKAFIAQQGPLN